MDDTDTIVIDDKLGGGPVANGRPKSMPLHRRDWRRFRPTDFLDPDNDEPMGYPMAPKRFQRRKPVVD